MFFISEFGKTFILKIWIKYFQHISYNCKIFIIISYLLNKNAWRLFPMIYFFILSKTCLYEIKFVYLCRGRLDYNNTHLFIVVGYYSDLGFELPCKEINVGPVSKVLVGLTVLIYHVSTTNWSHTFLRSAIWVLSLWK